jgi:hypothetical protein
MKRHLILRCLVLAVLISGVALAYDGDPPASRTGTPAIGGKPAEATCLACHNDFAINDGGSVQLLNAPAYYQPGTAYTMTVHLTSSQTAGDAGRAWGFQLTAVRVSDGNGTGTFANVTGQGTMIAAGTGTFTGRSYIEVGTGNRQGSASPVDWQVQWTAPNPGVGQVRFFVVGLAGDGGGGNNGDWVYTGSHSTDDVTPVRSPSWGAMKSHYRR